MARKIPISIFILLLIFNLPIHSETEGEKKKLQKINTEVHHTFFNINNISTYIYNNGDADISPTGNSGFIYPKGENKAAVFKSGLVWGAKVNGEIRVGGSTYNSGLRPGKILSDGTAEDPQKASVRVYRVRHDYSMAVFSSEINDGEGTKEEIRNQYELDWNEWPASDGAPFTDLDGDGVYNPQKDIPGVEGADQTLWFVANDFDPDQTNSLYGSLPLGIEMQTTVWGYNNDEPLGNMLFKKYKLINKSSTVFDSMYISIWSDPDLGGGGDDFVGCDTLLDLGFVYNGDDEDAQYGRNSPSMGFKLLQGPLVDGKPFDTGQLNGRVINGKKNLLMTSFFVMRKGSQGLGDPTLRNYEMGTLVIYNYFQSLDAFGTKLTMPDIYGGEVTKFPLNGNPITRQGWNDGILYPPGDRRFMVVSGPFTMAVGDTQEVVFAEIIAGAKPGIDRFLALQQLKLYCGLAQESYNSNFGLTLPIPIEEVHVEELDREIILSWYNNENIDLVESYNPFSYEFQGYTIYQFPDKTAILEEAKEVLIYDIIDGKAKITTSVFNPNDRSTLYSVVKNGSDSGIKRHASIKTNVFDSNQLLNNGTEYHFGLAPYAVSKNLNLFPNLIEPEVLRFSAVPQSLKPGTSILSNYGDTIEVTHTNGESNLEIKIVVVNPFELKGQNYKINFEKVTDTNSTNYKNYVWSLIDEENNILIDNHEIIINNRLGLTESIIVEGFQIKNFIINDEQINPLTENDKYSFATTKTIIDDNELAKSKIDQINVFPNPYYCTQTNEVDQYLKHVTFNHLPKEAIIRIYNLAGHLVRTFHKNDESQFLKWYLTNENNFPISSGLYIAHIELPELGKHKILKLAIIMETTVPDFL
ncbi:MAG: hypothetical protein GY936_18045 [Ignavibacteriae bacterium]|nr:hypothetical protein [Ignavibacteriota bacterium]